MAIDTVTTDRFLAALAKYPSENLTRTQIADLATSLGLQFPRWYANVANFRVGRGTYRKPTAAEVAKFNLGYAEPGKRGRKPGSTNKAKVAVVAPRPMALQNPGTQVSPEASTVLITDAPKANTEIQTTISKALGVDVMATSAEAIPNIPVKLRGYVEWGHFNHLSEVIGSKHFLPVMVTGPSGNGKTEMLEQVCANAGREFVRLNITNQTDEFDLLGGFQLVDGNTKYALGPVPMAMASGAVLLLDEIDLGGPALMCLQPVLEGKPLYLKKIGKYIHPKPGFTVVATANTKGRGDDGKYAHTNIMNEAMLERFAVMFEQGWPEAADERKILAYVMKREGNFDTKLVSHLVEWANVTRKNFAEQVCNDQVATRRLLHIVRAFTTLNDIDLVIKLALARFDPDVAEQFSNLWKAIHGEQVASPSGAAIPEVQF